MDPACGDLRYEGADVRLPVTLAATEGRGEGGRNGAWQGLST